LGCGFRGLLKLKIGLEVFKIWALITLMALKFVKIHKILLHKCTLKFSGPTHLYPKRTLMTACDDVSIFCQFHWILTDINYWQCY
jgi:hypothetical protein